MKFVINLSLFFLITLVEIHSFSLYDEKSDAIAAVNKKHLEITGSFTKLKKEIQAERQKISPTVHKEEINYGENKVKDSQEKLSEETFKSVKTAIQKGKPLTAIDCIGKVYSEGMKGTQAILNTHTISLNNILTEKEETLKAATLESDLIQAALKDLIDEAIKDIQNAKSGFNNLKKEAIKKCDTVLSQIRSIENRLSTPNIKEAYNTARNTIEKNLNKILEILEEKLKECLS